MTPKRKRLKDQAIKALGLLAEGQPEDVVNQHIWDAGVNGVSFGVLRIMTDLTEKKLGKSLESSAVAPRRHPD